MTRTQQRVHRGTTLSLLVAIVLVATGCGSGMTPTGRPFTLSSDELLARLIERGDLAGFSRTADFGETCATYLAGTERHQLVVGYGMVMAMRDVERGVRGLPWELPGTEPTDAGYAEPFRVGVVARCNQNAADLVRRAASIEYIANHAAYQPS